MKKFGLSLPLLVLIFLGAASLSGGSTWLSPAAWFTPDGSWHPIIYLRLIRSLSAALIGSSLALSGLIFQAVLRNPLADPFILGVSGGAGNGAALVIILGGTFGSFLTLPLGALFGAVIALLIVLKISGNGRRGTENLLLSGVIVNTLTGSLLMYLVSIADQTELAGITWWMLGDLQGCDPYLLLAGALVWLLALPLLWLNADKINALSLGDSEAWNLGVNYRKTTIFLVIIASLLAALPVALAGIIGFCGLIVPHLVRQVYGCDHRRNLAPVALWGAVFLLAGDLLSRLPYTEKELPIGVITAWIGGGFFLWLVNRRKRHEY